jgi:excisionase family DNA binding protein
VTPEDRVRAAVAELAEALLAVARETAASRRDAEVVELLSPATFARRASLSRSSLYLALASGKIRSVKVRGRRCVPASELARLAEAAS